MPGAQKIVQSGLRPAPASSLEGRVLEYTEEICQAFIAAVKESLLKIKDAEQQAIQRLNEYVPTEPLMDSKQAAAYLHMPLRTLQSLTGPRKPTLPFCWISGLKRFRKVSLDAWLAKNEVKTPGVKL